MHSSSRLDYCNSLLFAVAESLLQQQLQSVWNAAARLITGTGREHHATPARAVARILAWGVLKLEGEDRRGPKGRAESGGGVLGEGTASPLPTS